jgi:hypothetical protein
LYLFNDSVMGLVPVVQPTDYAILKLMAIANNPDRKTSDLADLEVIFRAVAAGFVSPVFEQLNVSRLEQFAAKFQVSEKLKGSSPSWKHRL